MFETCATDSYFEEKSVNNIMSEFKLDAADKQFIMFRLGIPFEVYQPDYFAKYYQNAQKQEEEMNNYNRFNVISSHATPAVETEKHLPSQALQNLNDLSFLSYINSQHNPQSVRKRTNKRPIHEVLEKQIPDQQIEKQIDYEIQQEIAHLKRNYAAYSSKPQTTHSIVKEVHSKPQSNILPSFLRDLRQSTTATTPLNKTRSFIQEDIKNHLDEDIQKHSSSIRRMPTIIKNSRDVKWR